MSATPRSSAASEPRPKPPARVGWRARCWAAFAFLTVWPWAARRVPPAAPAVWGRAVACYPFVGLVLGSLYLAAAWAWERILQRAGAGLVVVGLDVLLTGALHLDGLMDAADGLWGGHTPEARLRIMRDERVGAFGVLAGVLAVVFKAHLLTPTGVLLAPMLGRWAVAVAVVTAPYARPQGLGRGLRATARRRDAWLATGLVALLLAGLGDARGWMAWVLAGALLMAMRAFVQRRVGGFTGDLYGALEVLVEIVTLAALAPAPTASGPPWRLFGADLGAGLRLWPPG